MRSIFTTPTWCKITFYDDGVGTAKNRYLRAVSGAFGFGFKGNVRDLYEFLARYYKADEDDKVFMFGFSRGAATIRAFAGMVQECGLLDIRNSACQKGGKFDEGEFQKQIDLAMRAYEKIKSDRSLATAFRAKAVKHDANAPNGALQIEMIGVWDTVSALGFPQDWSLAIDWIFRVADKLSETLFPHNFYNYQLNRSVKNVYHALAIDDERMTFQSQGVERRRRRSAHRDRTGLVCRRSFQRGRRLSALRHVDGGARLDDGARGRAWHSFQQGRSRESPSRRKCAWQVIRFPRRRCHLLSLRAAGYRGTEQARSRPGQDPRQRHRADRQGHIAICAEKHSFSSSRSSGRRPTWARMQ